MEVPVPQDPLICGERVWLRPLEERDMPAYVAGINDRRVGQLAGYRAPISLAMAKEWLAKVTARMGASEGYYFAVCPLGSDEFIGTTWLKDIDWIAGSGELAIFMDEGHHGSGWGTDAQRALLAFGFGTLGLRRIWLEVFADNARALRSYEKLGFRREGVMREHALVDGRPVDGVLMAMLRSEWETSTRGSATEG